MAGSLVVFDLGEAELMMSGNSWQHSEGGHFLDCCFLCKRGLAVAGEGSGDIYMYRGDTPFCSEECREDQIAMDAAAAERRRSRRWKPAASGDEPTAAQSSSSCDGHQTIRARAADTAAVV